MTGVISMFRLSFALSLYSAPPRRRTIRPTGPAQPTGASNGLKVLRWVRETSAKRSRKARKPSFSRHGKASSVPAPRLSLILCFPALSDAHHTPPPHHPGRRLRPALSVHPQKAGQPASPLIEVGKTTGAPGCPTVNSASRRPSRLQPACHGTDPSFTAGRTATRPYPLL
jgi:hypothetical protein